MATYRTILMYIRTAERLLWRRNIYNNLDHFEHICDMEGNFLNNFLVYSVPPGGSHWLGGSLNWDMIPIAVILTRKDCEDHSGAVAFEIRGISHSYM